MSNVQLSFATKEDAIAFCEKHGWQYSVNEPVEKAIRAKSYGANFAWYVSDFSKYNLIHHWPKNY